MEGSTCPEDLTPGERSRSAARLGARFSLLPLPPGPEELGSQHKCWALPLPPQSPDALILPFATPPLMPIGVPPVLPRRPHSASQYSSGLHLLPSPYQ